MANNTRDSDNEDEDIFSHKDISHYPLSKGNRFIEAWIIGDFHAWLDLYHPELPMLRHLSLEELALLIDGFEGFMGSQYGFTVRDWRFNLERVGF